MNLTALEIFGRVVYFALGAVVTYGLFVSAILSV